MILADVKSDYVFFFSYVQVEPERGSPIWSNAEEMCRINSEWFLMAMQ